MGRRKARTMDMVQQLLLVLMLAGSAVLAIVVERAHSAWVRKREIAEERRYSPLG